MQEVIKSKKCREALVVGYNGVAREEKIPSSWDRTNTKMIGKEKRPEINEFRPIAITSVGYKLYLGFLKDEMEDFIVRNGWVRDSQIGFTKGGRMEYNHFILQYLVRKVMDSRRVGHKKLVLVALDFKKAYDSIDRGKLIETLVKFKINPLIINLVAKVYSGDTTIIRAEGKKAEIRVTSGIKQGCTASTVFFKLITYLIIGKLEEEGAMVEVGGIRLNSIWFADDSILAANSIEGARRNIRIVRDISRTFGLEINERKSMVMVYKGKSEEGEIEGIKVVDKMKYLGMEIGNKKDIFKGQKQNILKRIDGRAYEINKVIETSCNKLLIGKTWWKCGIVAGELLGVGVMNFNKGQIDRLQKIENRVYRRILGAGNNTSISVMRGEIGASLMRTRIIESRLTLVRSIIESNNGLVKKVLENIRNDRNDPWNRNLEEYLGEVGLGYGDLEVMEKKEIKRKVREQDSRWWKEDLNRLSSVKGYRDWKKKIKEERCYDNTEASVILFRARANTLNLNTNNRHRRGGGITTCEICGEGEEDLSHFILKCRKLERKRDRELFGEGEEEVVIGKLLFSGERIQDVKVMLGRMWKEREYLLTLARREG